MKYDEIYPGAKDEFLSEAFDKLPPVMKMPPCDDPECSADHECAVCSTPTLWVNGTAGLFVCSQECNSSIWNKLLVGLIAQQIVRGP